MKTKTMVFGALVWCLCASAFAQATLGVRTMDCTVCDESLFVVGGQTMLAYDKTDNLSDERYYIKTWGLTAHQGDMRSTPDTKLLFTVWSSAQTLSELKFIFSYEYSPGQYYVRTIGVQEDNGVGAGRLEIPCPKAFLQAGKTARYILALAPSESLKGGDWFVINLRQISGFIAESTGQEVPTIVLGSQSDLQPPRFVFWKNPLLLSTTQAYLTPDNGVGVNFQGWALKVVVATPVAMSGGMLGLEASTDMVNWLPLYCEQPAAVKWTDRFATRTLFVPVGSDPPTKGAWFNTKGTPPTWFIRAAATY